MEQRRAAGGKLLKSLLPQRCDVARHWRGPVEHDTELVCDWFSHGLYEMVGAVLRHIRLPRQRTGNRPYTAKQQLLSIVLCLSRIEHAGNADQVIVSLESAPMLRLP
ncbi:MAG TPA: hypothetical protein VFM35_10655 [Candidatus Binatia bacterium]|nr:hypothetical protein [Candidatus Binatia bacterium]